jgi:hypothetical protein
MKTLTIVALLMLVLPLGLKGADGINFTSVGVRYLTTNGVFVAKSRTKIASVTGQAFERGQRGRIWTLDIELAVGRARQ